MIVLVDQMTRERQNAFCLYYINIPGHVRLPLNLQTISLFGNTLVACA